MAERHLTAFMLVNSVYDLQNMENNLAGNYALGRNIDAGVTATWNGGAGFVPIGSNINAFSGVFDGYQNSVTSLYINPKALNQGYPYVPNVGLFAQVGTYGVVEDLTLSNVSIGLNGHYAFANIGGLAGSNLGTILRDSISVIVMPITQINPGLRGAFEVGGLVGNNSGTVSQSSAVASISQGVVVNNTGELAGDFGGLVGFNSGIVHLSYASGLIDVADGSEAEIGGLVGRNYTIGSTTALITQSLSTSNVSKINIDGGFGAIGGLVGGNNGEIIQSVAVGSVTSGPNSLMGGLVGGTGPINGTSQIANSYSTGTITITPYQGATYGATGGLAGYSSSGYYSSTISQSYSASPIVGSSNSPVGGFVGGGNNITTSSYWDLQAGNQSSSVGGMGLTTSQLKSGLPNGFDPKVWGSNPTINNGYPYLLWQTATVPPPASTTLTGGPIGVTPTTIVVEANPETKIYGSRDPAFGYQILSGTLSGGATLSGSLTRAAGENVGNYAIDEGTLSLPPAYTLVFDPSYLTITPAALTITAVDRAKSQGVQLNLGSTAFTTSKLFYSDTVSGVTLTSAGASASAPISGSPYPITPSAAQGSGLGNYNISYVNGLLTVLPSPVSVVPSQTNTNAGGVAANSLISNVNGNATLTPAQLSAITFTADLSQTLRAFANDPSGGLQLQAVNTQTAGPTPPVIANLTTTTNAPASNTPIGISTPALNIQPISQTSAGNYTDGTFATDSAQACLAAVYTMVERAVQEKNTIPINTYYTNKDGAILPSNLSRGTRDDNLMDLQDGPQLLVIIGSAQTKGGSGDREPHYMLGTDVYDSGGQKLITAVDPWSGVSVTIDASLRQVINPPSGYINIDFTADAFRTLSVNPS